MLISWVRIVAVVARACVRRREGAGGAGQVERDRGQHQPGGVGRELPGGQMRQRAVLQIGDDLLDDRVPPVIGLGLEHRQRRIGEHGVMPPDREQLTLSVGDDMVGVGVADPAHDQPGGDLLRVGFGPERGERDLGDLGVGNPLPQLLVVDRVRVADRCPRRLRDRRRSLR